MPWAVQHVFTNVDVLSKIGRKHCNKSGDCGVDEQSIYYPLNATVGPSIVQPRISAVRRYSAVTKK